MRLASDSNFAPAALPTPPQSPPAAGSPRAIAGLVAHGWLPPPCASPFPFPARCPAPASGSPVLPRQSAAPARQAPAAATAVSHSHFADRIVRNPPETLRVCTAKNASHFLH